MGVVEALLTAGAKVKVRNKLDLVPLAEALIHGRLQVAKALISHGADLGEQACRLQPICTSDEHSC